MEDYWKVQGWVVDARFSQNSSIHKMGGRSIPENMSSFLYEVRKKTAKVRLSLWKLQLNSLITSTLDGTMTSSHSGRFDPGKKQSLVTVVQDAGWTPAPVCGEEKNLLPLLGFEATIPMLLSPYPSLHSLSYRE
jgi:hypothetical protein